MTTPHVTDAVLRVVKNAGFHIGETKTLNTDGTSRCVLNAVDARTGESFTVAAVELVERVGIDLEDG